MKSSSALLCLLLILASAAVSADVSVHRMITNGRSFELLDTRQLTTRADGDIIGAWISPDGKYVAYPSEPAGRKVCLVRASGGNPSVLLSCTPEERRGELGPTGEAWVSQVGFSREIAWSPDSRLIAFSANHVTASPDASASEMCVLVMTTGGLRRAVIPLPKGYWSARHIVWSPDSHRLAFVACGSHSVTGQQPEIVSDILVFDLLRGSLETLYSVKKWHADIDSWSADSKALRYLTSGDQTKTQLRESRLDGQESVVIEENHVAKPISADGRLQIVEKDGLGVQDIATGVTVQVLKAFTGDVIGWTPDSRFIVYGRCDDIGDSKDKTLKLGTVWLAATESGKLNHMCAAIDVGDRPALSFSSDSTRMAFVSAGRVKVAEFGWNGLSTGDKLLVGIPLSEEEEKVMLLNSAKQIGTAINMYTSDWDGKYPAGDTFMQDILPYCRNKSIFFRPGTEDPIFQYYPLGSESDVQYAGSTVMGMFDIGYGWQIILYADGHAKVVPKQ